MKVEIAHPTDKVNFSRVTIDDLTIWFSYATPIAFHQAGMGFTIRENDWGVTTGKHLNYIRSDKSIRISGERFEERLAAALDI
jgi:hypothetical protein